MIKCTPLVFFALNCQGILMNGVFPEGGRQYSKRGERIPRVRWNSQKE